jgi:hypothetical protein
MVLIALAAVHGVATLILGRKVEARIQEYRAKGDPVSGYDLAGPTIPDFVNGGVIYDQVSLDVKQIRDKEPKGEEDFALNTVSRDPKRRETPGIWEAAQKYASPMVRLLPELEAAAAKPECRYKTNWQDEPDRVMFPHFARLREVARSLSVLAALDARNGNMDGAVRALTAGYKVSESIEKEPVLIGMLVRVAILDVTSQALKCCAGYGHFDQRHARQLYDVLSNMEMQENWKLAMNGERECGIQIYKSVPRRGADIALAIYGIQDSDGPSFRRFFLERIVPSYAWRPFLYADELCYFSETDGLFSYLDLPYRQIISDHIDEHLDLAKSNLPEYAVFAASIGPNDIFRGVCGRRDQATASISGDQIFLALLAYKDIHGSYPRTLDELRSELGWKLKEEPFSGKDFIYKLEGKGFLLYSIGINLKDDGGRSRTDFPRRPGKRGLAEEADDIAWRMDR